MERVLAVFEMSLLAVVTTGGFLPTHESCDLDLDACSCHVTFSDVSISCKALGLVEWPDFSKSGNITIDTVDVSENWLHHIPENAFGQIELYRVELRGNYRPFGYDPDVFSEIQRNSLVYLDLRDNALEQLPKFVSNLGSLETLLLTGNNFREIGSTDLTGLPNLQALRLPVITSMDRNTLAATNSLRLLEIGPVTLSPSRKSIKQFFGTKMIVKLRDLETLILSDGKFGLRNDFLTSFQRLQHIEVSNCQMKTEGLPNGLQLTELVVISLASNLISKVPRNFIYRMYSLTHLDLSHNSIVSLDRRNFHNNTQLEHLDLSHNRIKYIERATFAGLSDLHFLDLSHNNIKKLDPERFSPTAISDLSLRLGSNPFRCDCDIWWLAQLARKQVEGHPGPLDPYEASHLTCGDAPMHSVVYDMLMDTCPSLKLAGPHM